MQTQGSMFGFAISKENEGAVVVYKHVLMNIFWSVVLHVMYVDVATG